MCVLPPSLVSGERANHRFRESGLLTVRIMTNRREGAGARQGWFDSEVDSNDHCQTNLLCACTELTGRPTPAGQIQLLHYLQKKAEKARLFFRDVTPRMSSQLRARLMHDDTAAIATPDR
jgi:hypothetical protein